MITIKLDHQITLSRSDLTKDLERSVIRLTTHRDPLYDRNKKRGWIGKLTPHIKTYILEKKTLHIWRGCLQKLIDVFEELDLEYQIDDQMLYLDPVDFGSTIVLRDYQEPLFDAILKLKQTVIRAPCGSGKSETSLAAIAHFGQPTLILVWQQRQQKNWIKRIPEWFNQEAGIIGGASKKMIIKPITVGMIQTVRNRLPEIKNLFGAVFCDETQRVAAKTLGEVVNALPAAIRVGVSDDERRKDEREFLIYDTFGQVGAEVKGTIGQCPVDIVQIPTIFKAKSGDQTWTELIADLTQDPTRNKLIVDLAVREVKAGKSVLIWSDRVDHCQFLCDCFDRLGIVAGLLIGGTTWKDEADWTEAGLNNGSVKIGIGTSVAEQAINIPPLDVGIMTCASADTPKFLRFRQMRGRLARLDTNNPHKRGKLYYLRDQRVSVLRYKANSISQKYNTKTEIL